MYGPYLPKQRRSLAILGIASLSTLALAAAIIGSIITGSNFGPVNNSVESVSAFSNNWLSNLTEILPLGFAFGAGMVSAVNPCGFVMIPAYLSLYVNDQQKTPAPLLESGRLAKALRVSFVMTLGFILLFVIVGLAITAGIRPLIQWFPWAGLSIGLVLIIFGSYLLIGGSFSLTFANRLAIHTGNIQQQKVSAYFAFGLAYGLASISCTLPIFLTVVGSALTIDSILNSLGQFLLYSLGMGFIILVLTLSIAAFQGALVSKIHNVFRYFGPASAIFTLLAGTYIVYYWLTLGREMF